MAAQPMGMYLTPLTCTFKNAYHGKFMLCILYHNIKNISTVGEIQETKSKDKRQSREKMYKLSHRHEAIFNM